MTLICRRHIFRCVLGDRLRFAIAYRSRYFSAVHFLLLVTSRSQRPMVRRHHLYIACSLVFQPSFLTSKTRRRCQVSSGLICPPCPNDSRSIFVSFFGSLPCVGLTKAVGLYHRRTVICARRVYARTTIHSLSPLRVLETRPFRRTILNESVSFRLHF